MIEPSGISTQNLLKWTNIKNTWKEIGLSSTSHGLPNILRSDKIFFKIFRTIFLLVCSSFCIYSIVKSIQSYLDWEVVTKIEVIDEMPTKFPAVTICNLNFLATDYEKETFKTNLKTIEDNLNHSLEKYFENECINKKIAYKYTTMY